MLNRMTDERLAQAVRDLHGYLAELRSIPNRTKDCFRVCNSLGAGILDWRIGDSQREELKFATTAEFHDCLLSGYSQELRQKAAASHRKNHEIMFTHGDLNPRNILADENGTITGIVDWECSGWFPEYWEYTKAHFAVRYTIRWLADVIDQLFTSYRAELLVENTLTDYAPFF
jgi:aminoglycoside phosphotransferase (APT) family kinase protein